jgi:hypothetical protein
MESIRVSIEGAIFPSPLRLPILTPTAWASASGYTDLTPEIAKKHGFILPAYDETTGAVYKLEAEVKSSLILSFI